MALEQDLQAAARAALGETEKAERLAARAEAQALSLGEEQLATEIRERRTEYLPERR